MQLECAKFASTKRFPNRCGCGRQFQEHSIDVRVEAAASAAIDTQLQVPSSSLHAPVENATSRWQVKTHTREEPTSSYGTVEFQGGPHPTKARYVRLHYDTKPDVVMHLLLREWKLRVPSLVISTLGGLANCPLQEKLRRVVQSGLLRAAKTTGAWVITNGLDTGVTRHVGEALSEEVHVRGSNIVALGIAPWGVVQNRDQLVGLDHTSSYHTQDVSGSKKADDIALNSHHNYFLLADNGTVNKFGAEICLRRRLEQFLAQQPIDWRRYGGPKSRVPVVGLLIEGGAQTFRTVFELVTGRNPVPIVICDGSGRAADLLAFMHRFCNDDGDLPASLKEQILMTIGRTFQLNKQGADSLYMEMRLCMKRKDLISVFRMGDGTSDEIDIAILTALLQASGQNLTLAEQLSLTMAWNRPDIARSKVFTSSVNWPVSASRIFSSDCSLQTETLNNAMADALLNDRLDFVQLLLEKGLSIQKFLTIARLEEMYAALYSMNQTFHRLFIKVIGARQRISLRLIGQLVEQLIGSGYQHPYCAKSSTYGLDIPTNYPQTPRNMPMISNRATIDNLGLMRSPKNSSVFHINGKRLTACPLSIEPQFVDDVASEEMMHQMQTNEEYLNHKFSYMLGDQRRTACFRYPYTELLQWTLLAGRYELARYMVLSGEESIAKALISVRILRGMRKAIDTDSEAEFSNELKKWEGKFEELAVELQAHCYRHDAEQAKRLLTYELKTFSKNTCLSLAYLCESKMFISHPCTQSILNDLWYGGLREGKFVGGKVALILVGLVIPPFYPFIAYLFTQKSKFLEFKTREELARQPQTLEEFLEDQDSSDSSDSSHSSSSSNSDDSHTSCDSSKTSSPSPSTHHRHSTDEQKAEANM
ncbi:Transient receptor putative cation channel subfamily M member 3 [Cichlidogyrus casuarinus]|uniref:Transient receptor putative cation channel subfamily M member 3 n=1 Tax=Cichlidogyrus casuarinus TaxID=1844966 RepID=A0ABD2QHA6_9PLAT